MAFEARSVFLCLLLLVVATRAHSSNHALIVSSSRYWFNYRHNANALTIYKLIKEKGFRDENIILMLADEYSVNPRNVFKNRVFTSGSKGRSLMDENTEIDYRGEDVTVRNFVNILTGQQPNGLPVLDTDAESNILIYMTGHGGDQFFKFQDVEEVMTQHLAAVFRQMHVAGRYNEILLIADTCQAFTLGDNIDSPNVTVIGSSLRGESSYAHHSDYDLGLSVIERYTYSLERFLRGAKMNWQEATIESAMVKPYTYDQQRAHIGLRDELAVRKASVAKVGDFFVAKHERSAKRKSQLVRDESHSPRYSLPSYEQPLQQETPRTPLTAEIHEEECTSPLNPSDGAFLLPLAIMFGGITLLGKIW